MKKYPSWISKVTRSGIALLCSLSAAHACMWIHGTTIHGDFKTHEGRLDSKFLFRMKDRNVTEIDRLFHDYDYSPNDPIGEANDKAVQTLLLGDAQKAILMLESTEKENPGVYYTAANLGTAYELAGNDAQALKWLQEGIRRNPKSHMNTEWLHLRILETKLKLQEQPDWLLSSTITQVNLAKIGKPDYAVSTAQGMQDMWEIRTSLYEQLSVRILLVKPKDVIVAQLLVELAHFEHILGFQESVIEILDLAVIYGKSEASVSELRKKANLLLERSYFARLKHWLQPFVIRFMVEGSVLGLILIFMWRFTRRFFKARHDTAPQSLPISMDGD
jgi:tetratricopeptide (TPR) repeat protein